MSNRLRLYEGIAEDAEDEAVEVDAPSCWNDLRIGARIVWSPDGRPIRRIAPRSRKPVGMYTSRKAGRLLAHESRGHGHVGGEKLAIMRREIDPSFDDLRTQHVRFDMVLGGRQRHSFPDLLLLRHDGVIVVEEVKHDARWKADPDYSAVVDAIRGICDEIGWLHTVSTAKDVAPSPTVRDSIVRIQSQRFCAYEKQHLNAVLLALAAGKTATMRDLKQVVGGMPGAQNIVMAMMCHGHIRIPLDRRPDDDRTTIELAGHRFAHRAGDGR